MLNINNWRWDDPMPGVPLGELSPGSVRAMCLLARNRDQPHLQTHLMQILGAIEMIEGMEYHYEAFVRLHRRIARGGHADELHLRHEGIAYLNRLGQFHAFAQSNFVASLPGMSDYRRPTIEALMPFRNKHAAHRSIDAPRQSDTPTLQHAHARAFSRTFGTLFHPRPGSRRRDPLELTKSGDWGAFRRQIWRSGYLVFQLRTDEDTHLDFSMEEQHPLVMREADDLIERVITCPAQGAVGL